MDSCDESLVSRPGSRLSGVLFLTNELLVVMFTLVCCL